MSLNALTLDVRKFRDERNWAQFHTLRNLIISLNLEAAELLELMQWKTEDEISRMPGQAGTKEALSDECADVLLYLLLIADCAGIDLEKAARAKLIKNAEKYPVAKSFGTSRKYTQFED